ncbi:MAG: glutathione S-transferase family protein [Pseudomonadota bacterium]
MPPILLHHYPQSPVSEKVRVALGIKGLAWGSVIVPRIPPKPDLMPLTGGYRRAPVLQIGADIYCDSQCILRALERRFPEPSFFPGGDHGLAWGLSRWSDGELMNLAVRLVLGSGAAELPPDFARDRARLYFGPDVQATDLGPELPHITGQIRAAMGWLEDALGGNQGYLTGDQPGLADALAYYLVWFLRGRWAEGPDFLAQFPRLVQWEKKVAAIGHGEVSEVSSQEALGIARGSDPETGQQADPLDPQGLEPGMRISVLPDVDGGDPAVMGQLQALDRDSLCLIRDEPAVGRVAIHFPRAGYRVSLLD